MKDHKFEAGQVWKYRNRPGEEASLLFVLRVDTDPKFGEIIHIGVVGVKIRNPAAPKGLSESIQHMPLSKDALSASVTTVVETGAELPDFQEGYDTWKKAFDAGEAGVFSVTVADCVGFMETAINSG